MRGTLTAVAMSLWAVPFIRAVWLYRWARESFADSGSINAHNDLAYASLLLVSYAIGAAVSTWLAASLKRSNCISLSPPTILSLACAGWLIHMRPEEPIVLFPVMHPLLPAAVCLGLGLWGVVTLIWHSLFHRPVEAT